MWEFILCPFEESLTLTSTNLGIVSTSPSSESSSTKSLLFYDTTASTENGLFGDLLETDSSSDSNIPERRVADVAVAEILLFNVSQISLVQFVEEFKQLLAKKSRWFRRSTQSLILSRLWYVCRTTVASGLWKIWNSGRLASANFFCFTGMLLCLASYRLIFLRRSAPWVMVSDFFVVQTRMIYRTPESFFVSASLDKVLSGNNS